MIFKKAFFCIFGSVAIMMFLISPFFSCTPRKKYAAQPVVLTEDQKRVKIVSSTPEINRKLRKRCEVVGVTDGGDITSLRVITVEKGGNYAEVLCTGTMTISTPKNNYQPYGYQVPSYTTENHVYSSSIIYKCPCDMDDNP